MNNVDLAKEARKHFVSLAEDGSSIKEVRQIAPGVVVAIDALDDTFLYYFSTELAKFRNDRFAQLWCANDQSGPPEGCSENVLGFVCGINRPTKWNEVIKEAECRIIGVNGDGIAWFPEPREIAVQ